MARAPAQVMAAAPRGLVDTMAGALRRPRAVMASQVAAGLSEPRALVHLMLACGLFFVASLPMAVRTSADLAVDEPLSAAVSAHLFAWGAVAPLIGYGLAAAIHIAARGFGGRRGFLGTRAALFWSALAVAPAVLAGGLLGAVLPGRPAAWLGYGAGALWIWIFAGSLAETAGFASTGRVAAVVACFLAVLAALIALAARNGVR